MADRPPISHVVVVGLMGSGKTTVGQRLAARLGWPHRDSDTEIEAATGRTVRELRDAIGLDAMHDLEARQLLESLAAPGPLVVSPAASAIDVDGCREAMRRPGVAVVFLVIEPAEAARRFRSGEHRPWFGTDPEGFLATQAADRDPRFRSVATIELETTGRTVDQLVQAAIGGMAGRGLVLAGGHPEPPA